MLVHLVYICLGLQQINKQTNKRNETNEHISQTKGDIRPYKLLTYFCRTKNLTM